MKLTTTLIYTYFHAYHALVPSGKDNRHRKYTRNEVLAIVERWIIFSWKNKDDVNISVLMTIEKKLNQFFFIRCLIQNSFVQCSLLIGTGPILQGLGEIVPTRKHFVSG